MHLRTMFSELCLTRSYQKLISVTIVLAIINQWHHLVMLTKVSWDRFGRLVDIALFLAFNRRLVRAFIL